MSTTALAVWRPLTRADLTTFDDFMTGVVMEYTSLGWLGKMSTKGHAVLRAPDGVTTVSVSRSSSRASSGTRARADLDRWKNSQPGVAFGISPSGYDAAADVHLTGILARAANDTRAKEYLTSLLESGVDPDEMHARIAVMGNEKPGGDWVLMDTITRKVFAWSKDLDEDEAQVIAYGMLGVETEPEPEPEPETEYQPYTCHICEAVLDSGRSLGGHMNGHLPVVTCGVCGWKGKYHWSHMAKKHPDWVEPSGPIEIGVTADLPERTVTFEPMEALAAAEPVSEPSSTLDPLDAVQALIAEVQEFRVRAADFLALGGEVAALRKELADVTQQRDDLQARLDLLRETLAL